MTTTELFIKEDSFAGTVTLTIRDGDSKIQTKVTKDALLEALRNDLGWTVDE